MFYLDLEFFLLLFQGIFKFDEFLLGLFAQRLLALVLREQLLVVLA